MGWFDEQIRERIRNDEETFEDSFINIAGAVMGNKISLALQNERQITKNAIDEILKFYHLKSVEVPDSVKTVEEQLEYILRPHGIMRREVRLTGEWYKDAYGAMLGIRKKDGRPVAFLPRGEIHGYNYIDPGSGRRVIITKLNRDEFEDLALVFYKPFPLRKLTVRDLAAFMAHTITGKDIAMVMAASAIVALLGMLSPRLNNILFSDVIESGSALMLIGVAIFLASAKVSALIFTAVRSILMSRINTKLSITVEAAAMMRLLSLPADFFKKFSSGELSSKLQYLNMLCEMLISTILSTILSSAFSLVYLTQIFKYAPALALPSIVIILTVLTIILISAFIEMRIRREFLKLSAKKSGMSFAMISGIRKIRLSGAEKRSFARWGNLYAGEAKLLYDPPKFIKVSSVLSMAVFLFGTAFLQYLAVKTGITQAEYYAFNTAYGMVSGAFIALSGVTLQIANIAPIMDEIRPILETEPEVDGRKQVVTRISGGVELNNVSFRYSEGMPLILDNISLKIRPGQYVAIVGKTGCGKSTLMRILLGFERPQKGAVYYDGKDINTIDLKSLRRKIGAVTQNGKLFQGSIFENIIISAPDLRLSDAWEAADLAGMKQDIEAMPMGMFTLVSEGGGGISGGQRQRLMIARAIAPKPKLLMFDEATSALDNITQKKVSDSLNSLKCTRIVIAHRLSTIKACDRIIVLDGGRIIEDGTYDELIRDGGFFADLVARQRLDDEEYVGRRTMY